MNPITASYFLFGTAYFKNFDFKEGFDNWKLKIVETFKVGMMILPVANFMMYQFAPPHLRTPVLDVFNYFYAVTLSYINNTKSRKNKN